MLFRRMRRPGREAFLLESVEGGESVARYTFLGADPLARVSVRGGETVVEMEGKRERWDGPPLAAVDRLVRGGLAVDPNADTDMNTDLPPLSRGAVGYLTYDAVRLFEAIPEGHAREGDIPDALFLVFDAVIAFDHPRQRVLLMTTIDVEADTDPDPAVSAAVARLDRLEADLVSPDPPGVARRDGDARFVPVVPRERFLEAVAVVREAIASGEVYQAVISQRWIARLEDDPFDVYRALRTLNPSPYLYYLETREASILGSSPEMLVRCRGREVETRPIAGTVPRGRTAAEDTELAERLKSDPKERAEHVMLVDLARNDLGRVCEIGSVQVARYADVERFSHVQHLVSEVRGRLRQGLTAADALAACFPAGTLTGAPKIRAMELIDALEPTRRGIYGGAVGYFDAAGNCDLAIAIRTAVVERGLWRVQAGAGIVADSVAEREYAEAEFKAAALFRSIDLAREWFR
jgi:anthranilate synthase component 1